MLRKPNGTTGIHPSFCDVLQDPVAPSSFWLSGLITVPLHMVQIHVLSQFSAFTPSRFQETQLYGPNRSGILGALFNESFIVLSFFHKKN